MSSYFKLFISNCNPRIKLSSSYIGPFKQPQSYLRLILLMSKTYFGLPQSPKKLLKIVQAMRRAEIPKAKLVFAFSDKNDLDKYLSLLPKNQKHEIQEVSSGKTTDPSTSSVDSDTNKEGNKRSSKVMIVNIVQGRPTVWFIRKAFSKEFKNLQQVFQCVIEIQNHNFRVIFTNKQKVNSEVLNEVKSRLNMMCSNINYRAMNQQEWYYLTSSPKTVKYLQLSNVYMCSKIHYAWAKDQDLPESQFNEIIGKALSVMKRTVNILSLSANSSFHYITRSIFCELTQKILRTKLQKIESLYDVQVETLNLYENKKFIIHAKSVQQCKTVEQQIARQMSSLVNVEIRVQLKNIKESKDDLFQRVANLVKLKYGDKIAFSDHQQSIFLCLDVKKVKKLFHLRKFLTTHFQFLRLIICSPKQTQQFLENFIKTNELMQNFLTHNLENCVIEITGPKIEENHEGTYLDILEDFRQRVLAGLK